MSHATSTDTELLTEAEAVADIAQAAASVEPKPVSTDELYVTFNPETGRHEVLDLSSHRANFQSAPKRLKGIVQLATLGSFTDYVTTHVDELATTIWVDQAAFKVVAVLDDHADGTPHWGEHRAVLTLKKTPEWQHWTDKSDRWMTQDDFAEHLQDGVTEIADPPAADMLEIAQTFQGKTKVEWRSASRVSNGEVQFLYHEEVNGGAGKNGEFTIPQSFKLVIAPFIGEEPKLVQARFLYRVKEGTLALKYKLERPHEILDAAILEIAKKLEGVEGFNHVYLGTPRS